MRRLLLLLLLFAPLVGCSRSGPDKNEVQASEPVGPVKGVDRSHKGAAAPTTLFHDGAGKDISLARFQGRPLLINLWASWCAPCVKELPTLDRFAKSLPGGGVQVIAVSQDSAPQPSIVAFLKARGVTRLAPYHDPKMALSGALGAEVLPTSVFYDAKGREVWRYVGDLDWTGTEATKLLGEGRP